jgi:prevent-host-death family protein
MIRATHIHSLTDFTRHAKAYVNQIKETRNPIVLTVNGDAQVVVQDAESYQKMVDELERGHFIAAVREGLADVQAGRVQDVDEAFAEILSELEL